MKLHLPKLLAVALLGLVTADAAELTYTEDAAGNTYWNVGTYNVTAEQVNRENCHMPSAEGIVSTDKEKLVLDGSDKLGALNGTSFIAPSGIVGFDDSYTSTGSFLNKKYYHVYEQTGTGTATNNFKINGTLEITQNAQVLLGGQYQIKSDIYSTDTLVAGVIFGGDLIKELVSNPSSLAKFFPNHAEYTGIIANKVVVDGYDAGEEGYTGATNLNTWNLTTDVLEVKGGKVEIHNDIQSGNNHFVYELKDSKQVRIHKELNIHGGTTVINLNSLDKNDGKVGNDTHIFTGFGTINFDAPKYEEGAIVDASKASIVKSWINQSAGTLTVNGKTASVGGLNINQTGGTMSISTGWDAETKTHNNVSWHILSDFGDSTIITDADDENTVLNIGGIAAYNSKYSEIKSLMTNKGVVFDPANQTAGYNGEVMDLNASVSIEQKGKGTINIINGFDLNNYHENSAGVASSQLSTITQSGTGIINMGGEYKGVTFDITQSGNGELNLNGSMNVNELTQTEGAGTITVAEGKTLNVNKMKLEGGVFINNGTVNGPMASQVATLAEEGDISTTTDAEATFITIAGGEYKNFGTTNADILVDGGTLTLENGSSVGNIEMKSGTILVTNDEKTATVGSITLSGGSITFEAGAQLTLQTGSVVELGEGVEVIVQMSADALAALEAGSNVTLFDAGTNTVEFNNTLITFKDDQNNEVKATVTGNTTGGNVTVNAVVPEPTTATLSLLALAALASRRRRK